MEPITIELWKSTDGKYFDTKEQCEQYEIESAMNEIWRNPKERKKSHSDGSIKMKAKPTDEKDGI